MTPVAFAPMAITATGSTPASKNRTAGA
jgi:hypothetical protein